MIEFLYFILFMAAWVTFVKISLYIYDRICYYYIEFAIENCNYDVQNKISKILG